MLTINQMEPMAQSAADDLLHIRHITYLDALVLLLL
jgi:hypothetical protein